MRQKKIPKRECEYACSVRRCRNDLDGINLHPEGGKQRRLCWVHWVKYCRETSGMDELEDWLKKND
jgi:hypothetical protein